MEPRPNIILITTDQQRYDAMESAANPMIRTPHMTWMRDGGIQFTRCYSESPVCVAARATLMTGRHYLSLYPEHVDEKCNPRDIPVGGTLPSILTRAGYQTRSVGKLHFMTPRQNHGWEHIEILEDYYREMRRSPERGMPLASGLGQNELHPAISMMRPEDSLQHWITERAIDFVETRDPTRPFLLHVGYSKPHPPLDPLLPYWLLYAKEAVPAPVYGDWSADPELIPAGFMRPTWLLNGADQFSPELIRDARRAYYALVTQVDYSLGLLFARLGELGLLKNTWLIFTSDHGDMLGDHHMGGKSLPLDAAARVPLLVRPPEDPRFDGLRGRVCDELTSWVDILPTCAALAGVQPAPCDGFPLLDIESGSAGRERLFAFFTEFCGVIERDWKYVFTMDGGAELLFHLADDPLEQRNLAADSAARPEIDRLRRLLSDRLASRGHPAAGDGAPRSLQAPAPRQQVRGRPWPGFHHPWHTAHDILH